MPGDQDLARLSVQSLNGVGEKLAGKLARLGIYHVENLLFHLPARYEDRTRINPIGGLQAFSSAQIEGEVLAADIVMGRRRSLMVKIGDSTGIISLRFFHFSNAQRQGFHKGRKLRCYGEARLGRSGLEIFHPEYQFLDHAPPLAKTLTPVYPTTEGITQQRLRNLTDQALKLLEKWTPDELIDDLKIADKQWSIKAALFYLHRPPESAKVESLAQGKHPAQQRLIIEELTAHQVSMLKVRNQNRSYKAVKIAPSHREESAILQAVGFSPTAAQRRVCDEIYRDLDSGHPMLRLLQGDVGSGKTLVAALAAASAIAAGYQVALMVPTEILAEQHSRSFSRWFPDAWKINVLTSRLKGKGRAAVLELVEQGKSDLVIGTHALFQDDVRFANLALVIIDEQHRFGVSQRLALQDKGLNEDCRPHQLVMTATPIPRTLAMSHYAHLDLSVIDELPPGRKPVTTRVISQDRRDAVLRRLREYCRSGHQVYWICTLVEEGEMENLRAAEVTAEELRLAIPELKIGLVHGRLKSAEKDDVMQAFASGKIDLLIATTVVEVGVDVPNASLMIIENPERLGLSQLHQLRGRVGRGDIESHCILLYGSPLSQAGKQRLSAMRDNSSGFKLAEIDLKLRGAGELLGVRQAGEASFHLVQLHRDSELIPQARELAEKLLAQQDKRADFLINRWLGDKQNYSLS